MSKLDSFDVPPLEKGTPADKKGNDRYAFTNILLVHDGPVGDVIMATAAMKMVREACPSARISLQLAAPCLEILGAKDGSAAVAKEFSGQHQERQAPVARSRVLDVFIHFKPAKEGFRRVLQSVFHALRLRAHKFDLCLLLEADGQTARRLRKLAGIRQMVCASHRPSGDVNKAAAYCTHCASLPFDRDRHMVCYYQSIVGEVFAVAPQQPWLAISACAKKTPDPSLPTKRGTIVLCFEVSPRNRHRWPFDYCVRLVRLLDAAGYALCSLSAPGQCDFTRRVAQQAQVELMFIEGSLLEAAEYLLQTDLLISADTGQVHLAAALGVPVLSLAGLTTRRTYPFTEKGVALAASLGCDDCRLIAGCLNNKNNRKPVDPAYSPPCMQALLPETVMEYALRLLGGERFQEGYIYLDGSSEN